MTKHMFLTKRPGRAAALANYIPPTRRSSSKRTQRIAPVVTEMERLKGELEFLSSYTTDTIYRLRYEDMKYDYVSPSVVRLLGFSPEEMKKIRFREIILETRMVTDGMRSVESFEDLESNRRNGDVSKWQADYLIRTKDGRKIWVSDISYPWFDDNGTVIGSIGSLRDISDRVEAENRIKEELSQIANTDALTGLANRREFFERLDQELRRLRRVDSDLSVLIVDLDHFKNINDTYGHDVGDSVLVQIAQVIQSGLRETDLVARIGGEEFAILLPDTPGTGAKETAERIRAHVVKHNFELGVDKKPMGITVSIGVATAMTGQDMTASEIYKIADTRLYIAKNSGRNQTSVDHIHHTH